MVYVIGEMACAHDGNIAYAKVIIDAVGQSGADAVQLQIWKRSNIVIDKHNDTEILDSVELSNEEWSDLVSYIRTNFPKLEIIACVYDEVAAAFAYSLNVNAFKIHASDLASPNLLKFVAAYGKRMDLSVGGATIDEITEALEWIREANNTDIWLMFGKQLFPTKPEDANIIQAKTLQAVFGLPVGYQDHSPGSSPEAFNLPVAAIGSGIKIIEKHITHNRDLKGVDYQASLNPSEFVKFVAELRTVDMALGSPFIEKLSAAELQYRKYSRKSIVYAKSLTMGHVLEEDDLVCKRANGLGLPPKALKSFIGCVLKTDVNKDDLVIGDAVAMRVSQ